MEEHGQPAPMPPEPAGALASSTPPPPAPSECPEGTSCVVAFVVIYPTGPGGTGPYTHSPGHTIRCRFPQSAEGWLDGLIRHGRYSSYEAAREPGGAPIHYRGAKVFRARFATPRTPSKTGDGLQELVAVWEGAD